MYRYEVLGAQHNDTDALSPLTINTCSLAICGIMKSNVLDSNEMFDCHLVPTRAFRVRYESGEARNSHVLFSYQFSFFFVAFCVFLLFG